MKKVPAASHRGPQELSDLKERNQKVRPYSWEPPAIMLAAVRLRGFALMPTTNPPNVVEKQICCVNGDVMCMQQVEFASGLQQERSQTRICRDWRDLAECIALEALVWKK